MFFLLFSSFQCYFDKLLNKPRNYTIPYLLMVLPRIKVFFRVDQGVGVFFGGAIKLLNSYSHGLLILSERLLSEWKSHYKVLDNKQMLVREFS